MPSKRSIFCRGFRSMPTAFWYSLRVFRLVGSALGSLSCFFLNHSQNLRFTFLPFRTFTVTLGDHHIHDGPCSVLKRLRASFLGIEINRHHSVNIRLQKSDGLLNPLLVFWCTDKLEPTDHACRHSSSPLSKWTLAPQKHSTEALSPKPLGTNTTLHHAPEKSPLTVQVFRCSSLQVMKSFSCLSLSVNVLIKF